MLADLVGCETRGLRGLEGEGQLKVRRRLEGVLNEMMRKSWRQENGKR